MIAHLIERKAAQDRFGRLGVYILAAKTRGDPSLFGRTADYIAIDDRGGDRVRDPRITNCASETLGDAIQEIEWTQALNTRSQADKTLHLIVSFQTHERPSLELIRTIEESLCEAIGLVDHQRISAVHEDTDNLHLHVAISKVHPDTYRNIDPYQGKRRLMQRCVELEIEHGLARDEHGVRLGAAIEPHADGRDTTKGRAGGRDQKMEAYAGRESLKSWIAEHAAVALGDAVRTAESWDELHKRLAEFGLNLVPRGAGFVVAADGRHAAVKASDVSPDLAFRALTNRLGPFQARGADIGETGPKQAYGAKPVHDPTRSEVLFKVYQAEREAAVEARKERRAGVGADSPLPTWQAWLQRRAEKGDVDALEVLRSRQWGREKFERDVLGASDAASVRAVILAHHKPKVRHNGDVHYALKDGSRVIDRSVAVHAKGITMASAALSLILARERFAGPITVKGDATYRQAILEAAVAYGFDIKFQDSELEAKRQAGLADARTLKRPGPIPSMNGDNGGERRPDLKKQATPREPDRGEEGARAYVDERNELRRRRPEIQDIPPHRIWTPADAGPVSYIRNVRFAEHESEGVILKRGAEYLVKPVTPAQAARAGAHFQRGDLVSLDPRGRFVRAPDHGLSRGGEMDQGLKR
jgi:hypothetical protein